MRIVFYSENYYRGGLDTFMVTLINAWPHAEDELLLICNARHPGLADISARLRRPCTINAHYLPGQSPWYRGQSVRGRQIGPVLRALLSLMRKALGYPLFVLHVLALALRFRRLRFDRLMVVNGGYPASMSCRAASIAWALAIDLRSIHNFHNFAHPAPRGRAWIEYAIDRVLLRSVRCMVTVSAACLESLRVRPPLHNYAGGKFIYNGIDVPQALNLRSDWRRELSIAPQARVVLMLATYEPRKGHEFFLRAFQCVAERIADAQALICGHGSTEEVEQVTRLVAALGLSGRVLLHGYRADVSELLRGAQVLVVPSQAYESFGLVIVEAMAASCPVVATRVGGIPEVLPDGVGGYLRARDDVAGFADAICTLLSDPQHAAQLAAAGYERYRQHFTAARMAQEYAAVLRAP